MCYSGWTFEELLKKSGREEYVGKLLSILDVLVDGRFDISKRSLSLLFRGSSNQRLIDVHASPYKWRSSGASRMTVTKL